MSIINKEFFENWVQEPQTDPIVCEDIWLKPTFHTTEASYDYTLGKHSYDLKQVDRDVRLVGTEEQIAVFLGEMFDKYNWQIKDSWDAELTERHLELYKKNNNEVLIINLI